MSFLAQLHSFIRTAHFGRRRSDIELQPSHTHHLPPKTYPRMKKVPLVSVPPSSATLADALSTRRSTREFATTPLPFTSLSSVCALALEKNTARHPYPSGGGRYPIETYVIALNIENLERGFYHYESSSHELAFLWPLTTPLTTLVHDAWAHDCAAIIVCTSQWEHTSTYYTHFALELALIEAGHVGQNILLAAAANNLAAAPLAGFKDEPMAELLDLDTSYEQVVYTICIGNRAE